LAELAIAHSALESYLSPFHPPHKAMENQWSAASISPEILGLPLIKSRAATVELQIGLERLKLNEQSLDFPPLIVLSIKLD
jgi:hypothetical protein